MRFHCLLLALFALAESVCSGEEVFILRKIIIADTEAKVMALPSNSGGDTPVYVEGVPLLGERDFADTMSPFVGKPISDASLTEITKTIVDYSTKHDRYLTRALFPDQNVRDGALRIVVLVARYNKLAFHGNRWFSNTLLQSELGIKPGDEVRMSVLEQAANWANSNPFRRVRISVNDLTAKPGQADIVVAVEDKLPVRIAASYDDAGTPILGRNHYSLTAQFGNLWGRDHQGSYQFTTSDDVNVYKAHSFDYRVPLPWRHYLQFSGAYVLAKPIFGEGRFAQLGKNIVADARYTVPIRTDENPIEAFAGVDFKQSNNNLQFGGIEVFNTKTDTFQATAGFIAVHRDKLGAWLLGMNVNASPGDVNSRNSERAFQSARAGAKPTYLYGTVSLQRSVALPQGFEFQSRAYFQFADQNLLSNEQLSLGGSGTLRGFDPNAGIGDEGYTISNELLSPLWQPKLPVTLNGDNALTLDTRFVGFFDFGEVSYKHEYYFDPSQKPLSSAGIGVRVSHSNNFSLNFDYGWQVARTPNHDRRYGRGHIKVVLAY